MFTLVNFNHIVKAVTHAFVSHLIYWKLYTISCSSGASPALRAVGRARWVQQHTELAQSTHHHRNSSTHPKWSTHAQKH